MHVQEGKYRVGRWDRYKQGSPTGERRGKPLDAGNTGSVVVEKFGGGPSSTVDILFYDEDFGFLNI